MFRIFSTDTCHYTLQTYYFCLKTGVCVRKHLKCKMDINRTQ